MYNNSNAEKDITHLYLVVKERVGNQDTRDNDVDDDASTSIC